MKNLSYFLLLLALGSCSQLTTSHPLNSEVKTLQGSDNESSTSGEEISSSEDEFEGVESFDIITVSNLNNSGIGSLQKAITKAKKQKKPTYILFKKGLKGTIKLSEPLIIPTGKNISIFGPGVDRDNFLEDSNTDIQILNPRKRGFEISLGASLRLENMTVTGKTYDGDGGGFLNNGRLELTRVKIIDSSASGNGGAIFNKFTGKLLARDTIFEHNNADNGGGIFNDGSSELEHVIFTRNTALKNGDAIFANSFSNETNVDFVKFVMKNSFVKHNSANSSVGIILNRHYKNTIDLSNNEIIDPIRNF